MQADAGCLTAAWALGTPALPAWHMHWQALADTGALINHVQHGTAGARIQLDRELPAAMTTP
jgi:hypothetical protein